MQPYHHFLILGVVGGYLNIVLRRRRRDVAENGWNDDGCGKKIAFPEEKVGFGFETFLKKRGFLENGKWRIF